MPKEIVVAALPIVGTPEATEIEGLVEVGWDHGTVQVGTMTRATVTHDTVDEGLWVDLDRREINALIRYLRKARDAAYGRDE